MWPFSQKIHKLFTISLTPQTITCAVLQAQKNSYMLSAYERTPFKQLEFAQAIPFNISKLKKIIKTFAQQHKLQQTQAALSISGPPVLEKVVTLATAHPQKEDFDLPDLEAFNWDFLYLCPSQKKGFDFFVCGIKPHHLFSYQLLAKQCDLQLATLTTGQLTHLHLYKYLQADTFRQAKLSLDLLQQRYDVKTLLTKKDLCKAISVSPELSVDLQKEYLFLKSALGLFLAERFG